jgi:hypothetical protein
MYNSTGHQLLERLHRLGIEINNLLTVQMSDCNLPPLHSILLHRSLVVIDRFNRLHKRHDNIDMTRGCDEAIGVTSSPLSFEKWLNYLNADLFKFFLSLFRFRTPSMTTYGFGR